MINLKFKASNWIFIPLIVLVYWQIAFCTAALKWDLLDVVFPFRYHFSSAVNAGHFPLWNPYFNGFSTNYFTNFRINWSI